MPTFPQKIWGKSRPLDTAPLRRQMITTPVAKPLLVMLTGTTVPNVKEKYGDFDAHFQAAVGDGWRGEWASADARDEATPLPSHDDLAGVIVSGSSSSVTDRAATPWMLRLEGWLREAVARETPILGVCFGHQILASALGGQVRKNPLGRKVGSLTVQRVADDPLLDGLPKRFDVNVSHQDHVGSPPPNARALITADHDELHAFAAGRFARAVQFHPEFNDRIVRGYLEARRAVLRSEGLDPEALDRAVVDAPWARHLLRTFVRRFVER